MSKGVCAKHDHLSYISRTSMMRELTPKSCSLTSTHHTPPQNKIIKNGLKVESKKDT